ncbi:Putative beta-catenin-like protein [Septoria linicola]|uniref:Beta-catenin-like protein n=1 Tax=Septoria linicola TaxID=215465 RepID=A0A9Q9AXR9_9PEZI|nr:Putative beta-catenin-like protein [Septoria linicola]
MSSIDDLFRKPSTAPTGGNKRKFEAADAQEVYKASKISKSSSPNGHTNGATDDEGDDEDGNFFGSGMTKDAAEALEYIDQADGAKETYQEEKIDSAWLRRLTTSFERKVTKNAELRAKYESDPAKFIDSEADLDAEIKSWSLLGEHPELYGEFAAGGTVATLVGLLAHENTDIAIGAIEIIAELLDEDVQAEQEQWDALVASLLDADLLELLMSNLTRLDEENESDRSGLYHSLAVLESLAGQQAVAEKIGQEKVMMWLCNRIKVAEKPVGQNKQYAAEVLQVLLQSSPLLRKRLAIDVEGVDLFLQLLAAYRKRDPAKDTHEEEYVENLFDALTCVVDESEGKTKFMEAEGVELCLIMLKEGTKNITQRALRVLDHATNGQGAASTSVCDKIVDAAGLKPLFSTFMKGKDAADTEHLLGIFSALLRLLPGDSAPRIRTLAKFTEKDNEKVKKLIQLRKDYAARALKVEKEIAQEQKTLPDDELEERADEWFSRRLDGGLFCVQMCDVILAWLLAEDKSVRDLMLQEFHGGFGMIKASLDEQMRGLEGGTEDDGDTREMLETLMGFLE